MFAENSDDMGRTGAVKHSIDTGTSPPVRQQCRRVPPFRREQAKKMIDDMLQKDIIQPSSSPWASPIILVPKKDGSLRFCIDYRKLNSVTRKDAYPLPRVDDTLEPLSGSKWFSTLDLICGYWQVEIEEKDRHKTHSKKTSRIILMIYQVILLWKSHIRSSDDLIVIRQII